MFLNKLNDVEKNTRQRYDVCCIPITLSQYLNASSNFGLLLGEAR